MTKKLVIVAAFVLPLLPIAILIWASVQPTVGSAVRAERLRQSGRSLERRAPPVPRDRELVVVRVHERAVFPARVQQDLDGIGFRGQGRIFIRGRAGHRRRVADFAQHA